MKLLKSGLYLKGVLLIAAGIILAFLPNLISGLFYIAGAAIIIYNVALIILGSSKGQTSVILPKAITGIILGFAVCVFPSLLSFGIPVVIGIVLCLTGTERILAALQSKKTGDTWILLAVMGAILLIVGVVLCFNPFSASVVFRKIVGVIVILVGVAMIIFGLRSSEMIESIIDIKDFSVRDDDYKRIK